MADKWKGVEEAWAEVEDKWRGGEREVFLEGRRWNIFLPTHSFAQKLPPLICLSQWVKWVNVRETQSFCFQTSESLACQEHWKMYNNSFLNMWRQEKERGGCVWPSNYLKLYLLLGLLMTRPVWNIFKDTGKHFSQVCAKKKVGWSDPVAIWSSALTSNYPAIGHQPHHQRLRLSASAATIHIYPHRRCMQSRQYIATAPPARHTWMHHLRLLPNPFMHSTLYTNIIACIHLGESESELNWTQAKGKVLIYNLDCFGNNYI